MESGVIEIGIWRLLAAYLFVLLLIVIVKWRGISREKQIVLATLRMTIQLVLAGYILTFVFQNPNPFLIVLIVLVMEAFAVYNVFKQIKEPISNKLKYVIAISLCVGTLASLLYFNYMVIHFKPWYEPRYFIPIAGMIIGNSMTAITLGVKTLLEGLSSNKEKVEGALMLGASPKAAVKRYVDNAFDAAILPTINNMIGMGIVFLPGMMTGQMLAGISPILAIKYQIAVLLGILGGVSLTAVLFIHYGYRSFFNKHAQLIMK
ncbi:ABC transporter permease [Bacillus chungangensis]|uniref:ABC transport system permease protein n=1 Tax=Bacillus chungangensis TaxID=587633 RepID=A0ABT9WYD3_9BACI|nr:iron export ABC transporter permease subunit FetB [Bacillus chungangensis]MDQ0178300.1 putative ABC transport system permease protein [Bacillus chungangensis]